MRQQPNKWERNELVHAIHLQRSFADPTDRMVLPSIVRAEFLHRVRLVVADQPKPLQEEAIVALCITIGTIMFVDSYRIITFGAVHCIFWVSCICLFFLQIPYIGLFFGLAIHLMWATDFWTPMPEKTIFMVPGSTLDYHEFFMNLPFALYGIAAFHLGIHEGDLLTRWHNNGFFLQRLWLVGYDQAYPVQKLGPHYRWEDHTISWIGKRSLEVYCVHQFIAFPFVWLLSHIIYLFAHHIYGHHS
jgi:uncharacterized membrane protein